MAREVERAKALYAKASDPRIAANVAALDSGAALPHPLTVRDVFAASAARPGALRRFLMMDKNPSEPERPIGPLLYVVVALLLLPLLSFTWPPADREPGDLHQPATSAAMRAAGYVIPALYDVHRGRLERGAASIAAIVPVVAYFMWTHNGVPGALGRFTSTEFMNISASFPLPHAVDFTDRASMLYLPYGTALATALVVCAAAVAILHALAIRSMRRERYATVPAAVMPPVDAPAGS
jgi:hypothetical protein